MRLITICAVCAIWALATTSLAEAATWSVQRMAAPQVSNGQFSGVSCVSGVCEAVGTNVNATGRLITMAERWNGQTWVAQTTPNPVASSTGNELHAVSCVSATECLALGDSQGNVRQQFAEHWDGTTWTSQDISAPAGSSSAVLNAISCVSASFCSAAGYYVTGGVTKTWVVHWNGRAWGQQATANPSATNSALDAVSCKNAKFCTAVGQTSNGGVQSAVAETWNGTSWTTTSTVPLPAGTTNSTLNAVSCPTASSCEVVGSYTTSKVLGLLAEQFNGSAWTPQTTTGINGPGRAVSCSAPAACTAIVAKGQGAARFNGTTWTVQTPVAPSAGGMILDVSCDAANSCTAVGRNGPGTSSGQSSYGAQPDGPYDPGLWPGQLTLAEQWNGSTWSLQSSRNRVGADDSAVAGTSCAPSSATCEAVGGYSDSPTFLPQALAEIGSGSTWTQQTIPAPPGSVLSAVSCTAASECTAVGELYTASSGLPTGLLAERWNGSTWTQQTMALPSSFVGGSLTGVSCPRANWCTAVGWYVPVTLGPFSDLAETWNGSSWSASTPGVGGGTKGDQLFDVSCASPKMCGATGYDDDGFLATWNGTQWSRAGVSPPPGSVGYGFNGVSCPTTTACLAIGSSFDNAGSEVLTVPFNLTTSSTQTTAPLATRWDQAVSCVASTSCEAVGRTAAHWNGTSWSQQPLPAPSANPSLASVSCATAVSCNAVGAYQLAVDLPYAERYS